MSSLTCVKVQSTRSAGFCGKSHVNGFRSKARLFFSFGNGGDFGVENGLDFDANVVQSFAHCGTFFLGHGTEQLHKRSHLAVFAEKTHADVVQSGGRVSLFDGKQSSRFDAFDFFFHNISVSTRAKCLRARLINSK